MENDITYVKDQICAYILENVMLPVPTDAAAAPGASSSFDSGVSCFHKINSLVRFHRDKLKEYGDFSFPRNGNIWLKYFAHLGRHPKSRPYGLFAEHPKELSALESRLAFMITGSNWRIPVWHVRLTKDRCSVYLNRESVTEQLLRQVLLPNAGGIQYGQLKKQPEKRVQIRDVVGEDTQRLSHYRARLVRDTLRRVLAYSEWNLVDSARATGAGAVNENEKVLQLQVLSIEDKNVSKKEDGVITIKCGMVINPETGKLARFPTQEYLNSRSSNMYNSALHKYGLPVKHGELIERLGAYAVTIDLLEAKHSSPVIIVNEGHGSTKGASFILYNCARIESLLHMFEERVDRGYYDPLPALDRVDLSLLREEEEWLLIFGYIFDFPNLIEQVVEQLTQGTCATHFIVQYLTGFVSAFSLYYRRVRVLTDTRAHLMPVVHARIYFIKALREILNKTLALLNIAPVPRM